MRIGIFELVDPPPGQAEIIKRAVEAIDYPWWRIIPALRNDPDGAVLVKWLSTGQGSTGLFYGNTYEVHLSSEDRHLNADAGFVFAHEVGHLVDRATFDPATRRQIADLFHDGDFVQIGHFNHDHPDAGHGSELWASARNAYPSRLNECYADQFVAAFAPTIWDGTAFGTRARGVRFVHWTDDHDAIRRLTLERVIHLYDDVSESNPYFEAIARAAELGLMQGKSATEFGPNEPLTRAQAATVMVRLHDNWLNRHQE